MSRAVWVAGNWKMNGTESSASDLARQVRETLPERPVRVALCPPSVHLAAVREAIAGSGILLGAQDCAAEENGAYTGEVSAAQLVDMGCECVIVGHSERRRHQKEDDALLVRKLARAFAHRLVPLYCVGETLEERRAGATDAAVTKQLDQGLSPALGHGLPFVIAYEPVWAIGTGVVATIPQAEEVHGVVRRWLAKRLGALGDAIPVLYGGSVNRDNAGGLLASPQIDGALVGGASLSSEEFLAIVRAAGEKKGGEAS